jgi:hypothetical protein
LRGGEQAANAEGGAGENLALPVLPPPNIEMKSAPSDFKSLVKIVAELNTSSRQRYNAAQNDMTHLQAALPKRRSDLQRLAKRAETKELEINPELLSPKELDARVEQLQADLNALGVRLAEAWAKLDVLTNSPPLTPEQHRVELTSAVTDLSGGLLELSLLQARARLDAITFDPVELTPEEGYCIASRYRRDWMNARASLVDSWRLIHFNANDLESDLDLVFAGDIGNVSDNPFDLRATNGRLRVGLQFDAPLTRLAERNVYRQSLIESQQARRNYYQFRDRIQRDVRSTLRQLRLDDLNFELRRAAVHVAITQVDLARLRLSEPARPVQASAPGTPSEPGGASQFGDTVARDLVNALIDLLNVQNDFLSVWVDHEVQRLGLDYELGVMELDNRGIRIEHGQPLRSYLNEVPCMQPCELPDACAPAMTPAATPSNSSVKQMDTTPSDEDLPIPDHGATNSTGPPLLGPTLEVPNLKAME